MNPLSLLLLTGLLMMMSMVVGQQFITRGSVGGKQRVVTRTVPVLVPNKEDLRTRRYTYGLLMAIVIGNAYFARNRDNNGAVIRSGEVEGGATNGGGGPGPIGR